MGGILEDRRHQSLKKETAYVKVNSDTEMLTFDMEKLLPTPELNTGIVYYKRQLWTYNLDIHNTCTESIASRGSHEIGSCILVHLCNLELYSSACGGQNRN